MSKTGTLIFFDESHRGQLIQDYQTNGSFSDALSVPDLEPRLREVALLAFSENTIDYIALMKRGRTVATMKSRVEFSDLLPLKSVPIRELEERVDAQLKSYFIRTSRGTGGSIPQKTWEAVIDLIKQLRPDAEDEIDRLLSLSTYAGYQLVGRISETLLQEREALGAALDIFSGSNQLRERVLGSWAPPPDSVQGLDEESRTGTLVSNQNLHSFCSYIPQIYQLQEESAIQHDLFNWEGTANIHIAGKSIFRQGGRSLEVLYANRNSLEKTLGVDLIYYNEQFELFALVQYKLMHEENERMVYRPDWQFYQEVKRMNEFAAKYELSSDFSSDNDFRLNADGFFVKLVPNRGLSPASGELIKGMYLPRSYLKFLLSPFGPKGKRGGTLIDFDNAGRYLANTDFVQVVKRGWLGTRRLQTNALKDLIRNYCETNRGVLVAVEQMANAQQTPTVESNSNGSWTGYQESLFS